MRRAALAISVCIVSLPLLACFGMADGLIVTNAARWACPSPTPKPYGAAGPVKAWEACDCTTNLETGDRDCDQCPVYYAQWEQEYGHLGGPPFPAPTTFGRTGTSYVFGERVEVLPVHVLVTARAGAIIDRPGMPADTRQLHYIALTWRNHSARAIAINYATQVRLRAVEQPDGALISDARWAMTAAALDEAGMAWPPASIPPGDSTVVIPILGPIGQPETVDLDVVSAADSGMVASSTPEPGTPTVRPRASPTTVPGADLQDPAPHTITIQWSNAMYRPPDGEPCGDPGVFTNWGAGPPVAAGVAAPPGADRLIQIALNQVGKPYIWGAKGPNAFDCSGLATWCYAQIGISIPHGTSGQWPSMRPVNYANLRPGDLVYMDTLGAGRVSHVGILAELNGNGQWDLIHAANPALGVRIDYDIFQSHYYAPIIYGFRTARA